MTDLADLLPEDFPNRDFLIKNSGTVEQLAKNFQEADKFINSSVRAPVQSKDSEDWKKFYQRLGAPEKADGYTIPGGDEAFQSIVGGLRDPALKAGVTTDQWDAIFGPAAGAMEAEFKGMRDVKKGWKADSKEKFGDDFEDKKALVDSTMAEVIGDEKIVESLKMAGLNENSAFMEAMLKVNAAQSDDNVPAGSGAGDTGPDFAGMAAKARLMVKEGLLNDVRHPKFEESMGEFIAISGVLAEGGYDGPDDERLMPSWYPKA